MTEALRATGLLALLAMMLAPACPPDTPTTPRPTSATRMGDAVGGPVPSELDVRLERRDDSALDDRTVVRFQRINRGPDPSINYRWLLYDDGRIFVARHSGDTSDPYEPFDTPLPDTPTAVLGDDEVAALRAGLQEADFSSQAPYQVDETVEDGVFTVVTARLGGSVHEVIYEAVQPPPVPRLERLLDRLEGGTR